MVSCFIPPDKRNCAFHFCGLSFLPLPTRLCARLGDLVSPVGQKIIKPMLTGQENTSMIVGEITDLNELR